MKSLTLSASLLLLLSLSGCSLFRIGPEVTVVAPEAPESYHPHAAQAPGEVFLAQNLFDTLVRTGPFSDEPVSGIAESWEADDDYRTFTFVLREDARWSNGDTITAGDVRRAWLSLLDPASQAPNAWYPSRFIAGAAAFASGLAGPEQVAIDVENERTVVVRLSQPLSVFPLVVSHHSLAIVSQDDDIYSGAFVLNDFEDGDAFLRRNRRHPDSSDVSIRAARLTVQERIDESDSLAWILRPTQGPPEEFSSLRIPLPALDYLILNLDRPPLDDSSLRRALSLAIDNEALVARLASGGPDPGVAPEEITPVEKPYDIQEAIDILQQNGIDLGNAEAGGIPADLSLQLELLINQRPEHFRLARELSRQWNEHLGIAVDVVPEDWPTYLRRRDRGAFELARAGWLGFYPDDAALLEPHTSGSEINDGGFRSLRFDELIGQAQRTAPGQGRERLLEDARRLLVEDEVAIIPLFRRHEVDKVDRINWSGWESAQRGRFSLRHLHPR